MPTDATQFIALTVEAIARDCDTKQNKKRTLLRKCGEGISADMAISQSRWRVWKTIDQLEQKASEGPASTDYAPELLHQVMDILELWANTWNGLDEWKSFLDKKSFQHEVEECLPALHHLSEWRLTVTTRFVAVDVCGGKGVFSMLLRYLASLHWQDDDGARLDSIILLEKVTDIDWFHLKAPAHQSIPIDSFVPLEIWDNCNLHEIDSVLHRMRSIKHPLAFTGIHLCKLLSPAFIGLANMLGCNACPYVCLAPCCMPRAVTRNGKSKKKRKASVQISSNENEDSPSPSYVSVFAYETLAARTERLDLIQRRQRARRRRPRAFGSRSTEHFTSECAICHSADHLYKSCPQLLTSPSSSTKMTTSEVTQRATTKPTPCWNCGLCGHFKADCTNPTVRTGLMKVVGDQQVPASSPLNPPVTLLDVTNVLNASDPMRNYADLLLSAVGDTNVGKGVVATDFEWNRTVYETNLINPQSKNFAKNDWNRQRKSLYLVAYAARTKSKEIDIPAN